MTGELVRAPSDSNESLGNHLFGNFVQALYRVAFTHHGHNNASYAHGFQLP
jgi:hypothetical protein